MSTHRDLPETFLPAELSFIAENDLIEVIPRRRMDRIELISGILPEMKPPKRVEIPLWLALLLRKQKRVHIVPPDWLLPERLAEFLKTEEGDASSFAALPFHWLEISDALLSVASDDIPEADTVVRIIRDLREVRQSKAREGLLLLDERHLQMGNIGSFEVNEIRPLFATVMKQLRTFNLAGKSEGDSDSESDGQN